MRKILHSFCIFTFAACGGPTSSSNTDSMTSITDYLKISAKKAELPLDSMRISERNTVPFMLTAKSSSWLCDKMDAVNFDEKGDLSFLADAAGNFKMIGKWEFTKDGFMNIKKNNETHEYFVCSGYKEGPGAVWVFTDTKTKESLLLEFMCPD